MEPAAILPRQCEEGGGLRGTKLSGSETSEDPLRGTEDEEEKKRKRDDGADGKTAVVSDLQTVDEFQIATALGLSVHTVRKDRTGARRIPFFKLGRTIRYSLPRVFAALEQSEVGGPTKRKA